MENNSTRLIQFIRAPRERVYEALIDGAAVQQWMVPDDMGSEVHSFEGCEGGAFRISLTYDAPDAQGKTAANTDTYHGRFVELVPNQRVVQVIEFETPDPAMQGEMRVTMTLSEAGGGTHLTAEHDDLPPGLSPADNELGWQLSLAKLAALVESA